MKHYGSKYTYELFNEFPSTKQKSGITEIAYQCLEIVFEIDGKDYIVHCDGHQKIIGIWDKDGVKMEKM